MKPDENKSSTEKDKDGKESGGRYDIEVMKQGLKNILQKNNINNN